MAIEKYGMQWADGTSDLAMHRWIYLTDKDPYRRFCHMKAGCHILWPEQRGEDPGWVWSDWTIRRAKAWCRVNEIVRLLWIGPSSSGKTTDGAGFGMWDFLCDPENTSIRIATNTLECLEKRTWSEIEKFWHWLPAKPPNCNFKPSTMEITCGPKGYIKGIAVKQGTEEQAMESIKGAHSPRVRIICDELDAMPLGTIKAIENASAGCKSFIFIGTGNPMKRLGNPLGIMCTPKSGNWTDASPALEEWETKWGTCLFFDGRKSPGVTDPARFANFLLNAKQIADTAEIHGETSPIYWSQRIGFFPPEGISCAVIDEPMLYQFRMRENVVWSGPYMKGLVYDPSYSVGGDRCMARVFAIGPTVEGGVKWVSLKSVQIKMELKQDVSLSDTIGLSIARIAQNEGIPPRYIAADCTGNQGAVTDVVEKHVGKGIMRIQYAGRQGNGHLDKTANDVLRANRRAWHNKRAEMYYAFRMFGRANQIRNLDAETATELTQVEWVKTAFPLLVEDKDEVRKRIGQSPDNADTAVMALDLARYRMGFRLENADGQTAAPGRMKHVDVDNAADFCKDDWQPDEELVTEEV